MRSARDGGTRLAIAVDRAAGDVLLLSVSGEVDTVSAVQLGDAIASAAGGAPRVVVVDLHGVPFIDSTGLSVLLRSARALAERGGQLRLCRAHGMVARLIGLTRVEMVLPVYPTAAEAAEAASAG